MKPPVDRSPELASRVQLLAESISYTRNRIEMVARIGKQAPCPCKNGLKFGDCHGKAPEPFTNTLDQINADQRFNPTWDAMAAAGVPFEGVHLSFVSQDKRMRFVGDKLFRRPPEETYHEFILALLRSVVGLHWFQKQKKLPVEQ